MEMNCLTLVEPSSYYITQFILDFVYCPTGSLGHKANE